MTIFKRPPDGIEQETFDDIHKARRVRIVGPPVDVVINVDDIIKVAQLVDAGDFYTEATTTNSYIYIPFGFISNHIVLVVESGAAEKIQFSFNGTSLHGELDPGDAFSMDGKQKDGVYIKSASGGVKVRIWSW